MTGTVKGIIHSYGLFWLREEVEWTPGKGVKRNGGNGFRLLGRIGMNRGSVRCADFRDQKGIYILHGSYGAYYVGLTFAGKMTLGARLLQHCNDDHWDSWDRFSWFGFRKVLQATDEHGLQQLKAMPALNSLQVPSIIRDSEAMLQRALGPAGNSNFTNFASAEEWTQVKREEREALFAKL